MHYGLCGFGIQATACGAVCACPVKGLGRSKFNTYLWINVVGNLDIKYFWEVDKS